MRKDEAWAKERLERWLDEHMRGARLVEGPDPPDLVVEIAHAAIALEVTRTKWFQVTDQGLTDDRTTTDLSLFDRLILDLDRKVGPAFVGDAGAMVIAKGHIPSSEFRAVRDWVFARVRDISKGRLNGELNSEYVDIRTSAGVAGKRVTGVVANQGAVRNISEHAHLSLETALREKAVKLDRVDWSGERWLALINTYFLAESPLYVSVLRNIGSTYGFSRILLLSIDGVGRQPVEQIFPVGGRNGSQGRDGAGPA